MWLTLQRSCTHAGFSIISSESYYAYIFNLHSEKNAIWEQQSLVCCVVLWVFLFVSLFGGGIFVCVIVLVWGQNSMNF